MNVNTSYQSYAAYSQMPMQRRESDFETMVADLMETLDTDADGAVSQTEFTAGAEVSGMQSSDIESAFSAMDGSGDLSLSSQELLSALQNARPSQESQMMPPPPPPPPRQEESEQSSEELFSALDTDSDGVISQSEFAVLFETQSSAATSEEASAQSDTADESATLQSRLLERLLSYYASANTTTSTLSLSA